MKTIDNLLIYDLISAEFKNKMEHIQLTKTFAVLFSDYEFHDTYKYMRAIVMYYIKDEEFNDNEQEIKIRNIFFIDNHIVQEDISEINLYDIMKLYNVTTYSDLKQTFIKQYNTKNALNEIDRKCSENGIETNSSEFIEMPF